MSILLSYKLTEAQAARKLEVTQDTMQQWRHRGRGPKFMRREGKIRYSVADLEDWLAKCIVDPAADAARRNGIRKTRGTRRGAA